MHDLTVIAAQFPTPYEKMSEDEKNEVGRLVAHGEVINFFHISPDPWENQDVLSVSQTDIDCLKAAIDDLEMNPGRRAAVEASTKALGVVDWEKILLEARTAVARFLQVCKKEPEKKKLSRQRPIRGDF